MVKIRRLTSSQIEKIRQVSTRYYSLDVNKSNDRYVEKTLSEWDKMHNKPVILELLKRIELLEPKKASE
jgi:hypothetical protein